MCRWPPTWFTTWPAWATKIEGNSINISVPYAPGRQLPRLHVAANRWAWWADHPLELPLLMAAVRNSAPPWPPGTAVVLKAGEQTPLVGLRLAELIAEAGVPDGVVNVVMGFANCRAPSRHDESTRWPSRLDRGGRLIIHAAAGT